MEIPSTRDYPTASVKWKKYIPESVKASSPEVLFIILGWFVVPDTPRVKRLSQTFANRSGLPTIAIASSAHRYHDDVFADQAKALSQFVDDLDITDVIPIGISQGGVLVPYLNHFIKKDHPQIDISGTAFISSMGMYDKSIVRHIYDVLRHGWCYRHDNNESTQNQEVLKEFKKNPAMFYLRVVREIQGVCRKNPYADTITAPVSVVHGMKDDLCLVRNIPDIPKLFPNSSARFCAFQPDGDHYLAINEVDLVVETVLSHIFATE